jgi:hypothetical protein
VIEESKRRKHHNRRHLISEETQKTILAIAEEMPKKGSHYTTSDKSYFADIKSKTDLKIKIMRATNEKLQVKLIKVIRSEY